MNCGFVRRKISVKIKITYYSILMAVTKKKLIIDITGIILTPGNNGRYCKGNGKHLNWRGKLIECCCDECDYMMCCLGINNPYKCLDCDDEYCPEANKKISSKLKN